MNIIICGAGRVGFTISKLLSEQGHSITVIDQSSEDIQKIDDTLDVKSIVGKATYPSILEKAKAAEDAAVARAAEIDAALTEQTKRVEYGDRVATAQQSLLDQVLAVLARDTAAEVKAMRDARAAIAAVKA